MPIEFVPDGIGNPHYLVFDPDMSEPWVANIDDVLRETRSFDVVRIFLLTPDAQIEEVHFESTDGDPDFLDWEVTFVEGGELVERIEYDPKKPDDFALANRVVQVNGFGHRDH